MAAELTAKQRAFVDGILDPECPTLAEAYRRAYDTSGMSPKVVRNEASTLRGHPGVTMALEDAQRALERQRARNRMNQARAVMDRLWAETDAPDATSASRISALRLIGLESGLFVERQRLEVSEPMPASEADTMAEIEALLSGEYSENAQSFDTARIVSEVSPEVTADPPEGDRPDPPKS